jgi:tetratricopeptide (TPR) repeat protein
VAASRPWDAEPWLNTEAEWETLCAALQPGAGAEQVPIHLEFLPSATQQALRAALQRGCDVLHFTGHGTAEGHLLLEDDYGLAQLMDADRFLRLLPADRAHRPCLVVLSACHSGTVGAALRKAGVDHVVAVDRATPIPDHAATAYVAAFYRALARGGRLDHAHRDGQNAAGLDRYTGDRSSFVGGPLVSERFRLLTRHGRARLARGRRGEFTRQRPQVAGPEFPRPRVSLVGRAGDLAAVTARLAQFRLVTTHGLGGVGKTALARVLARRFWETARFPGGLAWVGLEGRKGPTGLLEGLRVRLAPDFSFPLEAETARERAAALVDHLAPLWAGRKGLWVLDNFETVHGPEGVTVLRVLLDQLPGLRLLVTARHALGLPEEARYALKELELVEAVALFEARCDAPLAEEERSTVEAICERLDRLPLAVEQAALWVNGQSPRTLLAGLEQSALALTPAEEAAYPERQRGLAVNFRYNFERLGEAGRRVWCCFAVFLGQPHYAALARVAGFEGWERGLDELVRWQLARREGERYVMLPTVREYAALILREEGADLGLDEAELRARHAAHYLAYAQAHRGDYDALERELPDIFAGFDFVAAEPTRDDEMVAAYNWAVQDVLKVRGYWDEVLRWLSETSHACEALGDRAGLATTYNNIGLIHKARGEYEAALEWYMKDLAISEELGDRAGLAATYNNIGEVHRARGEYEAALEWYERSVALGEALGDRAGLAATYNNIGLIYGARGEYEAALEWYERSVALCEELGDRAVLAPTYNNIASVHYARGEYEAALEWYERSVALTEELGDRAVLATTFHNMGHIALAQGDLRRALSLFARSRDLCAEIGLEKDVAEEEEMIAEVQRRMGGTTTNGERNE